jgi:hypothetical protein
MHQKISFRGTSQFTHGSSPSLQKTNSFRREGIDPVRGQWGPADGRKNSGEMETLPLEKCMKSGSKALKRILVKR